MAGDPDYHFKVVIIGAAGTGKTALVDQLLTGQFSPHPKPTIGVYYRPYVTTVSDATIQLELWDTAGQETYKSVARTYFRGCVGAILVFDITSEPSFDELQFWLTQFRTIADPNAFVLLVGNKIDRECDRRIDPESAEQFARDHVLSYLETSALTAVNVKEVFEKISRELLGLVQMEKLARPMPKPQKEFVSKWPPAVELNRTPRASERKCCWVWRAK
jgi:small GTP-binding protein